MEIGINFIDFTIEWSQNATLEEIMNWIFMQELKIVLNLMNTQFDMKI